MRSDTKPRVAMERGHLRPSRAAPARVEIDADTAERGLARLVVALLEVLRQVIEQQALRRVEGGRLSRAEVERLGTALQALNEAMGSLREKLDVGRTDLDATLEGMDSLLQTVTLPTTDGGAAS